MRIIKAINRMSASEKCRSIGSFFVIAVFSLHFTGLKTPIAYYPYCFSMYAVRNVCPIIRILGLLYSLCPILFILVDSNKYNKLFIRVLVYVWLIIDICFILAGFAPTDYQEYASLFIGWNPLIAILFDCFLLLWTLQLRGQQGKKDGVAA